MTDAQRRRVLTLATFVALLALAVGTRLVSLQVLQRDSLRSRAKNQHEGRIEVPASRGSILDRNGEVLALSVATQSLCAHPRQIEDPRGAARLLAPALERSQSALLEQLDSDRSFVFLDRFMDAERAERVARLGPLGEGFAVLPSSRRVYPHGTLGVHVLGFANIDGIGVEGIEQRFDDELRGDPSAYLFVRDGRRRGLRQLLGPPPRPSSDVVLALDAVLQHITERELDRAMEDSRAVAGSAVVLDPRTGEVLALANRPAADANRFGAAPPEARTNRAAVHQYEPGSVFKIVAMAAALEAGTVRPEQLFDCEDGSYLLHGHRIRDTSPHEILSASQVLERSSNIGMIKVVGTLAPQAFHDAIAAFGFGQRTGIELPGESSGTLQPVSRWSGMTQASLAFGQELGATVLQMASAIAVIANQGVRQPPRVALGTRDAAGRFHAFPWAAAERVISARTAREVAYMLERAVVEGTGKQAQVAGYRVAGKTGTAQKAGAGGYSESDFVASFGGFAPLPSPRVVCLVVLDSPGGDHSGGRVAAPAFRRIMADALRYLRVPSDLPPKAVERARVEGRRPDERPAPHVRMATAPGSVPDLVGLSLRESVVLLASRGYRSAVAGRGEVVQQDPAAGTPAEAGAVVRLALDERADELPASFGGAN